MASGTGIAPFISLLRDPETYDLFENITVTWTTRTHAEHTYTKEINKVTKTIQETDNENIITLIYVDLWEWPRLQKMII